MKRADYSLFWLGSVGFGGCRLSADPSRFRLHRLLHGALYGLGQPEIRFRGLLRLLARCLFALFLFFFGGFFASSSPSGIIARTAAACAFNGDFARLHDCGCRQIHRRSNHAALQGVTYRHQQRQPENGFGQHGLSD